MGEVQIHKNLSTTGTGRRFKNFVGGPSKITLNILRLTLTRQKRCRGHDLTDLTYLLEISTPNQNK